MLPASLWHLAFVNKRLHAALTSDSGTAMWRRKLEVPSSAQEWIRKLGINLSDTLSDSDESSLEDDDDHKFSILGGGGESSSENGRKHRKTPSGENAGSTHRGRATGQPAQSRRLVLQRAMPGL